MKQSLQASTATTTVLIIGVISMVVASMMFFQSTDNLISAKSIGDGKQAEYAALACAEVALSKLQANASYAGNEVISLSPSVSCTITAFTPVSGTYTITTSATVGIATRRYQVVATRGTQVDVSSWKEVAN